MMRTNYKNQWLLAAILFCGLVMTSCSDAFRYIVGGIATKVANN